MRGWGGVERERGGGEFFFFSFLKTKNIVFVLLLLIIIIIFFLLLLSRGRLQCWYVLAGFVSVNFVRVKCARTERHADEKSGTEIFFFRFQQKKGQTANVKQEKKIIKEKKSRERATRNRDYNSNHNDNSNELLMKSTLKSMESERIQIRIERELSFFFVVVLLFYYFF